jgi:light-harvesting protein B-800-850 beta chain
MKLDKLSCREQITPDGAEPHSIQHLRQYPRAGFARIGIPIGGFMETKSDPNKVWPTGFTEAESEEIHRNIIQGTQIFGFIAVLAHLFAYIYSPWLK